MEKFKEEKNIYAFLAGLSGFAVLCVFAYFAHGMNPQDTTIFAFSYKYGFISRGFLGTCWLVLDRLLPISIMNFPAIYRFTELMTAVLFALLLIFFYQCLKRCGGGARKDMQYLILFLSVFTFPMFLTVENFGRLDEYLMILTVLCCMLIVTEVMEWLIVPICILCVLLHQGFVFMNVNIILVLLIYKVLVRTGKERKKYACIFILTFLSISALFLYFEFFSHAQGREIYVEVVELAKALSQDGQSFSESLVNHEILGVDVFEAEYLYHLMNYLETPIFVILFLPYAVMFVWFFKGLLKEQGGKATKGQGLAYLAVLLGAATVVPEVVLKVDYGRYAFAIIFYYVAIVICLMAMGDEGILRQVGNLAARTRKLPAAKLLIMYPLVFMPFGDVHIFQKIWDILLNTVWDTVLIKAGYGGLLR